MLDGPRGIGVRSPLTGGPKPSTPPSTPSGISPRPASDAAVRQIPDLSWVDKILDGIDADECEREGGWWETSVGAAARRAALAELKAEIIRRFYSPAPPD